jgi:protocatechuate 3,4-dioxygenase beta subunit
MILIAHMRRAVLAASGLVLLLPLIASPRQNPKPPMQENSQSGQKFKIAGTIVNAVTGAPLSHARVSIADTKNPGKLTSMITSENGHFEFLQLNSGKYFLSGTRRGYLAQTYEQHEQYSTAIVTGPNFATENLQFRIMPMALISGHVLDEVGDPVRGARTILYVEDHAGGITRINRSGVSTTDDQGFFDFNMIAPGNYFLSATAKPWYAVHPLAIPDATGNHAAQVSPSLDVAYPTTYFNGATEADRATPIEVKGGDRLQIDVHLTPAPALHLLFRVSENRANQPNLPLPPIFHKRVFDTIQIVQTEGLRAVGPGVYELSGIPPGRYTVTNYNFTSGQLEQSTDLDLLHDGQELNDSHREPLGSLNLIFKLPGQEPFPKQYVVALQDSRQRLVARKQGDPSGQNTLEYLPPGKYTLRFVTQTKPYYVARISSQAGDSLGHYVSVMPGAALELTASLSVGVVGIEGVVHKNGKSVSGVMVALVPKDPEAHIELFRRDQSDFDGTFLLQGVIPGSYNIVAVEDAWGLDWLQPSVLARYVQHGQELTIGELMRGNVHLPEPVEVQPH